ncbi:hypothetical protein [Nocardia arizonensis]|uniref:hypothetical protein n=1 Tax=Nocardia arizonensis TaxID=1141647 RepID=UPI000B32C070|nr:hypothetical protein [Nocardia arizonensis]
MSSPSHQDWHLPTSDDVAAGIDTNIRAAKTEYNRDNIPGALNHTGMAIGFPDWRDPNAVVAFGLVALVARSTATPRDTPNPRVARGDQPHTAALDGGAKRNISPDTPSKPQQPKSPHHREPDAEHSSEGHRAGESTEYAALNDKDYALLVGADSTIAKGKINPKDIYGDLPLNHPGRYRLAKVVTNTRFSDKDTGMTENAMAFALETGGRNDLFKFADHYEYVHAKYIQFKENLGGTDWQSSVKIDGKGQTPGIRHYAGKKFGEKMGELVETLEQDRRTVENSRWKARATDPSLRGNALDRAVRALRDLGFSDPVGAFYHALKHREELPAYELAQNSLIDAYHDSAGRTIREADRVRIRPDRDLIKLIYYRRVSDGAKEWSMEAIVAIHPDGTVRIASYGKAKVVEK